MVKRVFVFVLIGAMFFVGTQFLAVLFYAWEFDDLASDEVKFAPIRQDDSRERLVSHIREEALYYGLKVDEKAITVIRNTDLDSGVRHLAVDITYTTPVDLYYFTYQLRRHIHPSTMY